MKLLLINVSRRFGGLLIATTSCCPGSDSTVFLVAPKKFDDLSALMRGPSPSDMEQGTWRPLAGLTMASDELLGRKWVVIWAVH